MVHLFMRAIGLARRGIGPAPGSDVRDVHEWNITPGLEETAATCTWALDAWLVAADASALATAAAATPNARMAGISMIDRRMRMAPPYRPARSGAWTSQTAWPFGET